MASPGNPNQAGPAFDMNKFFKPTTNPTSNITNPTNPNILTSSPYPPSPSSFPPYSYPPPTTPTTQFHHLPQFHHQFHHLPFSQDPPPPPPSNLHHQRSVSYPTPPLQPPPQNPNPGARLMALLSAPPTNLDLPPQHLIPPLPSPGVSEFSIPTNVSVVPAIPTAPLPPNVNSAISQSSVMRLPSSKLPKGRHLIGDFVTYDIDVRLQGEVQPQLEVTPITKYQSDPQLVVGRQIAVNRSYICYGLKMGNIRVLNINTALRSLLKGHTQRVSDMAFFAEDVHLLASASVDGRFYVWKISEGPDEEDKPQITGKIVISIQIVGEGNVLHPRVCWHCHKQEILVIGIGKRVLRIDTTKVGKSGAHFSEEPLRCPIDKLIDGVHLVGNHEGEVTDLSMCQWMTTRLVSASTDGTIKIWEDRKAQPLLVLRPHGGDPVNSATFLTGPHRPDHIILITAGPLNREVKFWASAGDEGWLLPSDAESWHCTQTLDLKSSGESSIEEAFFNQVVAFSQAGLLLLANAKKNAIYAVHIEYGPNPAATRMDYIAEFTVTMPILSLTGTSDLLPNGEHIVQVYCVQTQAIQQYALDLSQCLPPPLDNTGLEKSDSTVSREAANAEGFAILESSGSKPSEVPSANSTPKATRLEGSSESALGARLPLSPASTEAATLQDFTPSNTEIKPDTLPAVTSDTDIGPVASPPLPLSPRLSGKLSGFRSPSNTFEPGPPLSDHGGEQPVIDYSVDRQMDAIHANLYDVSSMDDDSRNGEKKATQDDISDVCNPPVLFRHPTHLITPSEILMAVPSSESTSVIGSKSEGETNIHDVIVNNDMGSVEVEVKVVGEAGSAQKDQSGSRVLPRSQVPENKEKLFCSQASDLGIEMARECCAISAETHAVEEARQVFGTGSAESPSQPSDVGDEEVHDSAKDVAEKSADSAILTTVQPSPSSTTRGKKQKGKNTQLSGPSSPSPSVFNSTDSSSEPGASSSIPSAEVAFPQMLAIQETVNQLMTMQKEMQKQMTMMVTVPVTKEGRRLEASLGRSMEKTVKANADALWARFQEENAKTEKLARERTQQLTSLITNFMNKDLPTMLEKAMKKEVVAIGPAVARSISPVLEKTISSTIVESFQRGVGDKTVNQLEKSVNSKLEATVARQIQAQFQTSGKQALQDALKSGLEASVVPAFEKSCRAMFEQVDTTFQKGMLEHSNAAQQHLESTHSPLALSLRDAINSASAMTQTLSGELADGQRKLLALAAAGANSNVVNPLVTQLSNGPPGGLHEKVEMPLDPTKELSRLISEQKYEEAFTAALQRSDVFIVSWLCSQVDLQRILSVVPPSLSQGVLLSLLQQLACDIHQDTPRKLAWMTDVAVAINPADPRIAMHVRPIFEQVFQILNHQRTLPTMSGPELASIRLVLHVINSMLTTCK